MDICNSYNVFGLRQINVQEIDVNITSANTSTDENFCIFPILKLYGSKPIIWQAISELSFHNETFVTLIEIGYFHYEVQTGTRFRHFLCVKRSTKKHKELQWIVFSTKYLYIIQFYVKQKNNKIHRMYYEFYLLSL